MAFKPLIRTALMGLLLAVAGPAATAGPKTEIVAFGDSLMAGYELAPQDSFPAVLEQALANAGRDVTVANASVSGDTTAGGLSRLDWSVSEEADLVILELGANDALRGIPPEATRNNLRQMIERLKGRGIAVVLAGMLAPPNMGPEYEAEFNAIYPDLASQYDVPLYRFFLDGVAAEPALLLGDGMHPNSEGVRRIVDGILPLLERELDSLD